ncbi:MAG: zinc ribbon domain-containing protein [Succiniclasticum sp.]|uniref:zinc ribbon domain-containing protein n=1 Tax=Succiniclasticum sp. TaxID=2775030 RepID=UPI002A914B4F|nr:zinc ribbon domain-containing protein [Succiniclasticum sp.]MDY6292272.1 zinc ribbon domain-containing protein [Succiniclasticum sp.]
MMKTFSKTFAQLTIFTILFCLLSFPCFAEVRRVPADAIVEQGLAAVTVDAEGAEDFRYAGQKDKMHMYLGKIKPESKLKFVIRATLKNEKELPITGRSSLVRMQVVAKKGDMVIKKENYRKENMSNLYLNYTVPKDADTLEVIESFALTNKSKDSKFNQKVTTVNKLILSAKDEVLAAALGNQGKNNVPVKPDAKDNKEKGEKKDPINAEKNPGNTDKNKSNGNGKSGKEPEINPEAEANIRLTRIVSGTAFVILLAAVGVHFFLKNRKSNQIAAERKERKERLRLQAIERQKQLPQNNATEEADPYGLQENFPEEPHAAAAPQQEPLPKDELQQDLPQSGGQNAAEKLGAAAAATESTNPRFCQNCGAPLKPGARFCENCGNKA